MKKIVISLFSLVAVSAFANTGLEFKVNVNGGGIPLKRNVIKSVTNYGVGTTVSKAFDLGEKTKLKVGVGLDLGKIDVKFNLEEIEKRIENEINKVFSNEEDSTEGAEAPKQGGEAKPVDSGTQTDGVERTDSTVEKEDKASTDGENTANVEKPTDVVEEPKQGGEAKPVDSGTQTDGVERTDSTVEKEDKASTDGENTADVKEPIDGAEEPKQGEEGAEAPKVYTKNEFLDDLMTFFKKGKINSEVIGIQDFKEAKKNYEANKDNPPQDNEEFMKNKNIYELGKILLGENLDKTSIETLDFSNASDDLLDFTNKFLNKDIIPSFEEIKNNEFLKISEELYNKLSKSAETLIEDVKNKINEKGKISVKDVRNSIIKTLNGDTTYIPTSSSISSFYLAPKSVVELEHMLNKDFTLNAGVEVGYAFYMNKEFNDLMKLYSPVGRVTAKGYIGTTYKERFNLEASVGFPTGIQVGVGIKF